MRDFLEALKVTLAGMGLDSTVEGRAIRVDGVLFYCDERGQGFRFLGKHHRRGNVKVAVVDLLLALTHGQAAREKYRQEKANERAAKELEKQLDCGMKVTYSFGVFHLSYETDDLEALRRAAVKLSSELTAEWDDLLKLGGVPSGVKFDSEGGFSLN